MYLTLQDDKNIKECENIVKMIDYKVKETSISIVLEYLSMDLYTIIKQSVYPLDINFIKSVAYQILIGILHLLFI